MSTSSERAISFMFNHMSSSSEDKAVEYTFKESYNGHIVIGMTQLCRDIDGAKVFASNQRRSEKTLIEISTGGKVVASQDTIESKWQ